MKYNPININNIMAFGRVNSFERLIGKAKELDSIKLTRISSGGVMKLT